MTDRTVCCLVISFAAGLLFGNENSLWLCLAVLGFVAGRVFLLRKRYGQKSVLPALFHMTLCILLFVMGAYRCNEKQEEFGRIEQYAKEQGIIQVQGKIYRREEKQEQFIYYLKDAGILAGEEYYPCGRIQVYTSTDSYRIGNRIQAEGRYEAFQRPRNEGNFNEEQYYYSKNINLRMKAYRQKVTEAKTDGYQERLYHLRGKAEQIFQHNMSKETAGIMANITLGSRQLADPEIKALYQRAGISHILAVSGLHVSLFGMGLYRMLRRMCCPLILRSALSAGIVYSFGTLTGMELSTARAVMMFFIMLAAGVFCCTYDTVTALSVSAFLQLWENPFALWYAGFLLSYTAVLGAVVITKAVKSGAKNKKKHKIWDTIQTSLCIQMATLPVSLFFYYETALYSVLANGCVLPIMGALLFLGAAGGMLGLICPGVSALLLQGAEKMLEFCEAVCRVFTHLPGNMMITGEPAMGKILLYYFCLLALLYIVKKRNQGRIMWLWIVPAALLCSGNVEQRAEVNFLDVGQGDGIFLQSESGRGIFIDGGSTDVSKVGKYRILPFLKCRGMKQIDVWFVSHTDADHVSGLKEVLEEGYPVKNIVFAEGVVRDESWKSLVKLAEKKQSAVRSLKAGEYISLDGMRFTSLYPGNGGTDRNASSMVLLAEWEGISGIFTGDIGIEQEQELMTGELWDIVQTPLTFYKAAHHGSDNSNSLEILTALNPALAVVSCGEGNSYGHPGKEAVERMEKTTGQISYTQDSGQIRLWQEEGEIRLWEFHLRQYVMTPHL